MAIQIKFDNNNNAIPPTLVLANRNGNKLGYIPARNIVTADNLNEYSELTFKVYKTENGTDYHLWDDVQDFRLAWCPEWNVYFEIFVEIDESNSICKNVTAKSLGEAELSQVNLYNIEINTETDISRDDYKPTVLYDSDDPEASLLTRLLEKAPHYSIDHVDNSIKNIQRTFTFNDKSIYDSFQEISEEVGCIFIFDSSDDEGKPARKISVYDMETVCGTCGYRGVFDGDTCPSCGGTDLKHGYGDDTTIFVTVENLAESINYSSDVDSVKNCFKVEGGDDLMTATVVNCNPNGSSYIWNLTDAVRADMSDELRTKLAQYDSLYADYRDTHVTTLDSDVVSAYNALVTKYNLIIAGDSGIRHDAFQPISTSITGYPNLLNALYEAIDMQLFLESGLMPGVDIGSSAADEVAKLNHLSSLQFVAVKNNNFSLNTASNAVIALAKTYLDDGYGVKIKPGSTSLTGSIWRGVLTVTGYSNSDDTADTNQISLTVTSDYITYIKQDLTKTLHNGIDGPSDITELFKLDLAEFTQEIKKYCLASLIAFRDACQACMNILIEQNSTQQASGVNLYGTLYVPYYNKYNALQSEINLRNNEIAIVTGAYDSQGFLSVSGMQTVIEEANTNIQNTLNFENYVGETLWKEFVSYRREQLYSNDNYISDGLDNMELFDRARELIEAATKELYKSSHLQHTITATLENLLFMKEFQPIVNYFAVGNWIRLRVDGEIYKLRLLSYQIDHDNPASLTVEFSDIIRTADGTSDLESIVNQASSMATSYDSVMHQASKGKQSKDEMDVWVDKGLSLTLMKIMSNAENQKLLIDENGILARQYDDITEDYDDKQLRIINRGIYMTDDAWQTMRSGIGDFVYYDPESGTEVQAYGVIADTLVGKLMLSNKVYVYNRGGSIKLDENGLTLVSTKNGVFDVFRVKARATAQWGTAASASMKNVVSDYVSAKSLADEAVNVYVQATEPDVSEANANDLFVDSTTNNVYFCDGTEWVQYRPWTDYTLTWTDGGFINNADGVLITNNEWKYTDFVDIGSATTIEVLANSLDNSNAFYKEDQSFSDGLTSGSLVAVPSDAKYFRLSTRINDTVVARAVGSPATISGLSIGKYQLMVYDDAPDTFEPGDWWYSPDGDTLEIAQSASGEEDVIWMDNAGNAHFKGTIDAANGSFTGAVTATSLKIVDGSEEINIDDYIESMASSIATYAQDNEPTEGMTEGDIWCDTNDDNKLYRYDGQDWVEISSESLGFNVSGTSMYYNRVDINSSVGIKVSDQYGSYFQATSNKLGFYNSGGTPLMYISGGNAYFSGSISASTISASSISAASFTDSNGSKLSFGNQTGFYQSGGAMHVDNLTIDGNCTIGGTLSAVTGTFGGTNSLGISAEITSQGVLRFVSKNAPVPGTSQYQYETYVGGGDSVHYGSPIWVQYQSQSDMTNYGLVMFQYSYSGGHYFINLDIRNGWGQNYSSEGYSEITNRIFSISNGKITVANFSDAVYTEIANHIGGGSGYVLPAATSSVRGGITVGNGLSINGDKLSVSTIASVSDMQYTSSTGTYIGKINGTNIYVPSGGSSYTLPTASSSTKGGIKVGSGLAMSGETMYVTSVPTTGVTIEHGEATGTTTITLTKNFPATTSSYPYIGVLRVGSASTGVTFSISARAGGIQNGYLRSFVINCSSNVTYNWVVIG